ncbi:MAG: TetR/AcrR family transcriptional regulator [Solirubrobacterales bacterium]
MHAGARNLEGGDSALDVPSAGRTLGGDKARRIVEAMRDSVAEFGIAGSTFERVAARAGVSRGLLHYYFGTKERLLVEVIRRDTVYRIETLGAELRAAGSVDEVIAAFHETFARTLADERGYVYMVSELFVAGRNSPDLTRELGQLYSRARGAFADILRDKHAAGVIRLRFDAESVLAYLFAAGDGAAVQQLSDPTLDVDGSASVGAEVARFLLDADA